MSASNAELLAHAFAGWGKDNTANMCRRLRNGGRAAAFR